MAEEKNETEIEETGAEAPAEPAADDVADAADVAEGAVPSGESPPSGADEAAEEPVAEAAAEPDATEASGDDADVAVGAEGTVPSAGSSQAEPKPKKKRLPRALRPARTRRKRVPSSGRKPIESAREAAAPALSSARRARRTASSLLWERRKASAAPRPTNRIPTIPW